MSVKFNSVQLNIVTFVDVQKALLNDSLDNCVYIMDNSVDSPNQGTSKLQTNCKQGQVLNWIIYALDMDKKDDGKWPSMTRIKNIVFLDENADDVSDIKICSDLKVYGPPDKMRSNLTPVYYYWAGTVLENLDPGIYRYRFIIELETDTTSKVKHFNLDTPSLRVLKI